MMNPCCSLWSETDTRREPINFSYSPVPGDLGKPEGIICANTDDTDRIISVRQLRTLRDMGKTFVDSQLHEDIYNRTIKVLGENPPDFPFTLLPKTT